MFLNYSCLRSSRAKLGYRWCPQSCYYQTLCCVKRSLNEKHTPTKFCNPNRVSIFQKFLLSCISSNRMIFRIFKKHEVRISKLLRSRSYSQGNQLPPSNNWKLYALIAVICILALSYNPLNVSLEWDAFIRDFVMKGEVEKMIARDSNVLEVVLKKDAVGQHDKNVLGTKYVLVVNDVKSFEEDLREVEDSLGIPVQDRILIEFHNTSTIPFWTLILLILCLSLISSWPQFMNRVNPFIRMKSAKFTLIDPFTGGTKGVKFSDVAGLKEAKQEVMEFVDYLKRPEHYQSLGAKVPKGALLLGPPGCGKTLLAKAVASEANVPFLSMNGSEFIELIGGLGAARVRDLFSEAKKISPCIIYIDEIDAIGKKRADSGKFDSAMGESEHTLNQLLVEMDGMASREGVVTLASTNRADVLDKALLRPGRFDRHIIIDLPSAEERREIFIQYLKRIRLEKEPEHYAKRLASLTPGFSGADIANICNEAALHAARFKKKIVTGDDLEYAIDRVVGGTEKRSSALAPDEKLLVAYHEAGRALIGWLSEQGEILVRMSVVPRTNQTVGWTQFGQPEQYLFSQEELFDKMCTALGGRAAEALIFNRVSTKSEKELSKVTRIAYAKIRQYGMNDLIGPISFGNTEEFQRKPYSKQLGALIDEEARKLVAKAFQKADAILRMNKDLLIKLAEELLKRESMTYGDVEALIGPPKNTKGKMVEPVVFDLSIDMVAGPETASPKADFK